MTDTIEFHITDTKIPDLDFHAFMSQPDMTEEEIDDYLCSDFWHDSDKVKVNGIELLYQDLLETREGEPARHWIVCDFDTHVYPEHLALIKRFLVALPEFCKHHEPVTAHFEHVNHYKRPSGAWEIWKAMRHGIAYRGGEGYIYGLYRPLSIPDTEDSSIVGYDDGHTPLCPECAHGATIDGKPFIGYEDVASDHYTEPVSTCDLPELDAPLFCFDCGSLIRTRLTSTGLAKLPPALQELFK